VDGGGSERFRTPKEGSKQQPELQSHPGIFSPRVPKIE